MHVPFVARLNTDYTRNLAKAAVACGTGLFFVALSIRAFLTWRGTDFTDFYLAGAALLHRANPYAATPYFLAPAPEALPYLVVGWLPLDVAKVVWAVLLFALIPCLLWLGCRAVKIELMWWQWPPALLASLILCSNGWITGQPTLLIAIACAVSVALPAPKTGLSWWLLLIKPQITLPIAFLLCVTQGKHYWRYALGGGLAALSLSLLLYPLWPTVYIEEWGRIQTVGAYWWTTTFHDYIWYIVPELRPIITPAYILLCVCGGLVWLRLAYMWRQGQIDYTVLIINSVVLTFALTPYVRDYDFPLLVLPYLLLWRYGRNLPLTARWLLYGGLCLFPLPYLIGGDMPYFWLYSAILSVACVGLTLRLPMTLRPTPHNMVERLT